MRSVRRSEAASEAARFTAVVVFPTPPFWFAMVRIRLMTSSSFKAWPLARGRPLRGGNLNERMPDPPDNLFHVEQDRGPTRCSTWNSGKSGDFPSF